MKDLFGLALWNYFKGNKKDKLILIREDGTKSIRDLRKYFSSYISFSDFQKKALKHVKGKILDLGCGAGKHSLYLQKKGFDVTATDVSSYCIKICKKRGIKKTKVINVWERKKDVGKFDTLILFGNNLAIGGSVKGIKKLLQYYKNITTSEGIILLDGTNPKKYTKKEKQMKMRWEYKKEKSDWFTPFFVSQKDLRKIINGTSWEIEKIYTSKNNEEYSAILKNR